MMPPLILAVDAEINAECECVMRGKMEVGSAMTLTLSANYKVHYVY